VAEITSSVAIPEPRLMPRHVAIIMDGNGRWAKKRFLPRIAGHRRGVSNVRSTVSACIEKGIEHLTLFAFSSENWRRPADEVSLLMQLFSLALENEINKLHEAGIRFRAIGDLERFDPRLRQLIENAETLTADNKALTLTVAANYGGRWDIMQAVNSMTAAQPGKVYAESDLLQYLSMAYAPEPDLFIRTGGEQRVSNFLLWQLAYTEMYFTDTLWPDFDVAAFDLALASFKNRERRFGRTSEQVKLADAEVPEPVAVKR